MKLKLDENGNVVVQDGKPVYVHDDGRDMPFDAPHTVATISRLNAEAKANRERFERAETQLKSFEGIEDPAAARRAMETVKNIDDKKLVDAGKVDEVRAAAVKAHEERLQALTSAHANELAGLKKERDQLRDDLYSEKIGGSFTRSKYIADKVAIPAELVQARFGKQFQVEDGKIVAYDTAGNKIYSRARPGELADFDEAIETIIGSYPHRDHIMKGDVRNGSGAVNGDGKGGGDVGSKKASQMTPDEKAAYIGKHGLPAWNQKVSSDYGSPT